MHLLPDLYRDVPKWLNDNQGVVAVGLFMVALIFGWGSGLFRTMRHRPRFSISLVEGPTLCCIFAPGRKYDGRPTHRTAISLYLSVTNTGSAPSSLCGIAVGYRMPFRPLTVLWLRKRILRHWIKQPAVALADFQVDIGENKKVYPFLLQRSFFTGEKDTYLEIGKQGIGVVYFEEEEAWGGYFPLSRRQQVVVKIRLRDAFGGTHTTRKTVPLVSLEQARRFCPQFGQSFEALRPPDPPPRQERSE
jgi:hypothetical protein